MKSAMDCTDVTSVKRCINWPHGVLYRADGQPAAYKDLSVAAFVTEYVLVRNSEQDTTIKEQMSLHLVDLMDDTDLYGWDKILVFHT